MSTPFPTPYLCSYTPSSYTIWQPGWVWNRHDAAGVWHQSVKVRKIQLNWTDRNNDRFWKNRTLQRRLALSVRTPRASTEEYHSTIYRISQRVGVPQFDSLIKKSRSHFQHCLSQGAGTTHRRPLPASSGWKIAEGWVLRDMALRWSSVTHAQTAGRQFLRDKRLAHIDVDFRLTYRGRISVQDPYLQKDRESKDQTWPETGHKIIAVRFQKVGPWWPRLEFLLQWLTWSAIRTTVIFTAQRFSLPISPRSMSSVLPLEDSDSIVLQHRTLQSETSPFSASFTKVSMLANH